MNYTMTTDEGDFRVTSIEVVNSIKENPYINPGEKLVDVLLHVDCTDSYFEEGSLEDYVAFNAIELLDEDGYSCNEYSTIPYDHGLYYKPCELRKGCKYRVALPFVVPKESVNFTVMPFETVCKIQND